MAVEPSSKCRTCLQENQNMKLLSAEYFICDNLLTISEIISNCTSLEIIDNEKYPRYICETCLQDANTAFIFKKRCEQSENILKTLLIENSDETNYINIYNQKEKIESCFQCNKCPIKFTSQDELNSHLSTHTIKKYSCTFCPKQFNSEKRLNKHLITHASNSLRAMRRSGRQTKTSNNYETDSLYENNYSDNELTQEDIKQELDENFVEINENFDEISAETSGLEILRNAKEKNENGFYECLCCTETFEDISKLRTHLHSHDIFNCKICNKNFTLLSNLRRHLKSHCSKIKSEDFDNESLEFKCIGCDEIFPRRKLLSEHLKSHKEFICPICNVNFTFATNLRKHLNWHKKSKDQTKILKQIPVEKRTCDICFKVFKYRPSMLKHRKKHEFSGKKCKFCDKIFENSIRLYKHMEELHEHEKNIVCTECGKKFFREWNLKMHMIVHTGVKPYMCEICGVSFALGGNLASHKRLHTGQKPYKCQTCGREFTQQAALRSHEAGHSNRRDHVCPECGAAFSRAGAMRNHRKRHLSTKPFACTMCDKKFTFSSERKRHMAIHTGERNFVCDFCGKAFNRPTNLTVHRRIHTKEFPFKCDICGKGFVQAHCMRTHRNTHNKDIIEQGKNDNIPGQIQNEYVPG